MKALSIRQPWAWAILHAGKDIENRDWPTRFRGTVAVHAAKGMTLFEYDDATSFIWKACDCEVPAPGVLDRGAIVGLVDIVGCVSESPSPWFQGEYGFALANPRPLAPVYCKGALGFWQVPADVQAQIERQLTQ